MKRKNALRITGFYAMGPGCRTPEVNLFWLEKEVFPMESELVNLQRRVARLEAELAAISKKSNRSGLHRRPALAPLICAAVLMLCVGISLAFGGGQPVNAQGQSKGPSKVIAPFDVVNRAGATLFSVSENNTGGGALAVYGKDGLGALIGSAGELYLYAKEEHAARVKLTATEYGGKLELDNSVGKPVAFLGDINTGSDGSLQLMHNGDLSLYLGRTQSGPLLEARNLDGKVVVTLGGTSFGGDFHVRNNGGKEAVGIFSEQGQTGIVQLFDASGQERVTLGHIAGQRQGRCVRERRKGS